MEGNRQMMEEKMPAVLTTDDSAGTAISKTAIQEQAQFITFTIDDQEYGVDIMSVREIKGWVETTVLPNTPQHMRGVLNLRGVIVPIFDLRCRFGLGKTSATKMHVIVIIEVKNRMIGILVDTVSDILTVSINDIRPVPRMERIVDDEYLTGLVTIKERMVALLNQERLFNSQLIEEGVATGRAWKSDSA
ncbi:chemotaxis protein CheW [Kiloniella laminariae]|uniref:Chemotaxis protein CheW n=1 Tax=Kiloniella laminariae TaxID=454162 RepID=A0ABT4LMC3_9PROT|nr:chemotaxis protein CheW [Kiloniella laminariae]MCZ4282280.1 chemotaxis protein CheW [Kiloniella laminariae]